MKSKEKKNLIGAKGVRVPGTIDLTSALPVKKTKSSKKLDEGTPQKKKTHVDVALRVAQVSTASMGKFDAERYNEPKRPQVKKTPRQLEITKKKSGGPNFASEKEQSLNLLTKVLKKQTAPPPPLSAVPKPSKKALKKEAKKDNKGNKKRKKKNLGDGDTEINLEPSVNKKVQQNKGKKQTFANKSKGGSNKGSKKGGSKKKGSKKGKSRK